LKYLRRDRIPDAAWKLSNPSEYNRLLHTHQQRQKDILFEIKVMAREFFSGHRNIVSLFGVFFEDDEILPGEPNIFSPAMVLELADRTCPDLEIYLAYDQRLRPMEFDTVASIICDVADGLAALHSYGVIHADLKPSNILLFF
jgi:serine/threonine protein kinase